MAGTTVADAGENLIAPTSDAPKRAGSGPAGCELTAHPSSVCREDHEVVEAGGEGLDDAEVGVIEGEDAVGSVPVGKDYTHGIREVQFEPGVEASDLGAVSRSSFVTAAKR